MVYSFAIFNTWIKIFQTKFFHLSVILFSIILTAAKIFIYVQR